MELHEIITKLNGPISPVGETHTDNVRYENLKTAVELVEWLLTDINHVAINKDRSEYSMKRAGEYAAKFLSDFSRAYQPETQNE